MAAVYESRCTSREGFRFDAGRTVRHRRVARDRGVRNLFRCVLLLNPLASPVGASLDQDKPIRHFVQKTWQTKDGLPQNSVLAIAQTAEGYLWLGTEEGVARFDGVEFKTFDKRLSGLRTNQIQVLYVDREDNLWIGTNGGGLSCYRHGKFTTYTSADGLSNNSIRAIYHDIGGAI